jgi:hypothetical protein
MNETMVTAPVAIVPYWTYLIPVFIAIVGCIQVWGLAWIGRQIERGTKATEDTTKAVNGMEQQINSNMEKQIKQAIAEAIARERLRAKEEKEREK